MFELQKDTIYKNIVAYNCRNYICEPARFKFEGISGSINFTKVEDQTRRKFKIPQRNFNDLMQYVTISEGIIQEDCVIVKDKGDLLLIPIRHERFQEISSQEIVNKKSLKLKVGACYKIKKRNEDTIFENSVYLGSFFISTFKRENITRNSTNSRSSIDIHSSRYVFLDLTTMKVFEERDRRDIILDEFIVDFPEYKHTEDNQAFLNARHKGYTLAYEASGISYYFKLNQDSQNKWYPWRESDTLKKEIFDYVIQTQG